MKRLICILALSFGIHVSHAQAIDSGSQFNTQEEKALYQEMVRVIRCPTCQNQDIAESNAPLAKQLRDLIAEQIKAGKNGDEITDYLVERYGDFITYAPRLQKNTVVLWFAPITFMLFALGFWLFIRHSRQYKQQCLNPEQEAQLQAWLKQYGKVSS